MAERIAVGQRGWSIYDARRRRRARMQLPLSDDLAPIRRDEWTPDDWATPWPLVRSLEEEFGPFELDPCARPESAKAARYFTVADDGLSRPWAPARVFLNPPYSEVHRWLEKAVIEAQAGAFVAALLPVRSDQDWWHDILLPNAQLRYLRGRPRFIGRDGTTVGRPWFATVLAIFGRG